MYKKAEAVHRQCDLIVWKGYPISWYRGEHTFRPFRALSLDTFVHTMHSWSNSTRHLTRWISLSWMSCPCCRGRSLLVFFSKKLDQFTQWNPAQKWFEHLSDSHISCNKQALFENKYLTSSFSVLNRILGPFVLWYPIIKHYAAQDIIVFRVNV